MISKTETKKIFKGLWNRSREEIKISLKLYLFIQNLEIYIY